MYGNQIKIVLLMLLLLFGGNYSNGHAEIYIHQLKHQPADKLIPVLQPHLGKKTQLSADGFKLLVSGALEDNQKITQMLENLDTAFKEYLVQLRMTNVPINQSQTDSTTITSERQAEAYPNKQTAVKKYRSDRLLLDDKQFTVRLIENFQAYIATGETFPEAKLLSQYSHLIPSTGRQKVDRGVYIDLTAADDNYVLLKATAYQQQRQKSDPRNIHSSSATSRVKAKLNQWTLLASTDTLEKSSNSKRYRSTKMPAASRYYYVKVTAITEP